MAKPGKRTPTILSRLAEALGTCRKVLIVTHDNPDPDALAAAYGMRHLLRQAFRKQAVIVYGGVIGRAENRALVNLLHIPLRTAARFKFGFCKAVVMVDTQPGAGNSSLPPSVSPTIVVDHHPVQRRSLSLPFRDLRPNCGATSTIITQYLRAARLEIPTKLATALFFGIQTDTLDLSRQTTPADYAAYRRLFPLVDHRLLTRIEHPDLPAAFFQVARTAIDNAVCYGNMIFSNLGRVATGDSIAQMADYLVQLDGVRWSAVIGRINGDLRLSLRGLDTARDAGQLLRRVVGKRGSAGGHGMAAGGRVSVEKMTPEEVEQLELTLEQRLAALLASHRITPVPLKDVKS
jgi:nanoRNase/pAp phosphatase (c-di-AMP/oligoRNAs hydrolase)